MNNRTTGIGLLIKLSLAFFLLFGLILKAAAQVKIGDNPTSINANSALEVEATNKGILYPRVALTATNSASPLSAFVAGMTVYNTATAGSGNTAVIPGLYYSDGTKWIQLGSDFAVDPSVGSIAVFPFNSLPTGYLECNGAAVSRSTYAALFAKIGTTYGAGDGSTTFNLPDLRGEFIRGWDNGRGVDASRTLGSSQANSTAMPNSSFTGATNTTGAHTHTVTLTTQLDGVDDYNYSQDMQLGDAGTVSSRTKTSSSGGSHAHTVTINGGGDAETRPRNVAMVYAIKATESLLVPTSTSTAITAAATANEPWYKVGAGSGATANTDDVYISGRVGVGTNSPNTNAVIDATAVNKGILLPRVALTATNSASPLSAFVAGMTVYNTATAGSGSTAVIPGLYYSDGTKWVASSSGSEPWYKVGTTTGATSNTDNVYLNGNVGIGSNSSQARLFVTQSAGTATNLITAQIDNCGFACAQGTARNIVLANTNFTNLSEFSSLDFVPSPNASNPSGASIVGIDRDTTNHYAGLQFRTRNATGYAARMTIKSSGNVGIGTTSPNSNAALDISASDKGVLLPRLALTATNSASPLSAFVAGMTVYNTATAGSGSTAVIPGLYYSDGTKWILSGGDYSVDPSIGSIAVFPFNSLPTGYLECNGAAVSRSTYAALFAKIGTTYGAGNGSTTFNLPDLRGEFIRGWDNGRGVDASRTLGSSQANSTKLPNSSFTGTTSTNGNHTHNVTTMDNGGLQDNTVSQSASQTPNSTVSTSGAGDHTHTVTINGGGDAETRPRNVAMVYAIKAVESTLVPTATSSAITTAAAANEPWFKVGTTTGATANTDNIYIMGSKVGIGTTAPQFQLDVHDAGYFWDKLNIGSAADGNWGGYLATTEEAGSNNGLYVVGARAYGKIIFGINDGSGMGTIAEHMRITRFGQVGIGTSTPTAKLHLVNDGASASDDDILVDTYGNSTPAFSLFTSGGSASAPTNITNGTVLGDIHFGGRWNGADYRFNYTRIRGNYKGDGTTTLTDMQFATSGVNRMIIDENGRVGIGTSAPTTPLQVNGAVRVGTSAQTAAAAGNGAIRYNTTTSQLEFSNGTSWNPVSTPSTGAVLKVVTAPVVTVSGNNTTNVTLTFSYTPVSSNSILIAEFDSDYIFGGDVVNLGLGTDAYQSTLSIGGTQVMLKSQRFRGASGAGSGTRGSTILPISGSLANTSTSTKTITVTLTRLSGDDNINILGAVYAKITEIQN